MNESVILLDGIRAFAYHKFTFLDSRRLNKEGIAMVLRSFDPLTSNGVIWRSNTGGMKKGTSFVKFGVAGCPDIIGFTRTGLFIGAEAKKGGEGLSVAQRPFHACLKASGAISFVFRSYEECDLALKWLGF